MFYNTHLHCLYATVRIPHIAVPSPGACPWACPQGVPHVGIAYKYGNSVIAECYVAIALDDLVRPGKTPLALLLAGPGAWIKHTIIYVHKANGTG